MHVSRLSKGIQEVRKQDEQRELQRRVIVLRPTVKVAA